ncbi:MAG TPA: sigma-70 family RNA polymerase sigma factor [Anaeromyxobacter sp.]
MSENGWLAKRFEENRAHLRAVAYRMLGSWSEADDAVQEVWLRLNRSDAGEVENLGGWLTTVVARLCLDILRSRKSRREEPLPPHVPEPTVNSRDAGEPEGELTLAGSIGPALLVVLETLAPAERVAFVLHDMFDIPFEEIASIVGRSPAAARQLASRARRRVRGAPVPGSDVARQREVVGAFLAASRDGDFDALVAVLAPDVVLRADEVGVRAAAARKWGGAPSLSSEIRGAPAVAETFRGRARGASPALIDGSAGAVWAVRGQPRAAFVFRVELGKITEIELVMDPARLSELDIEIEAT